MEEGQGDEFAGRLDQLRRRFADGLGEKLLSVRALWSALAVSQGSAAGARELLQIVHRLAGSGGTFGFPDVSQLARSLEAILAEIIASAQVPNGGQVAQVEELLSCLVGAISKGPGPMLLPTGASAESPEFEQRVLLLDSDRAAAMVLADQLANFGYDTRVCATVDELRDATLERAPAAGLIDLDLWGVPLAGVLAAIRINAEASRPVPWLFLSARDDLEARLRAIHAGGRSFFVRPISLPDVLKALDGLLKSEQSEPYRVLIVEDDRAMAMFATVALEEAGLEVRHISEPRFFMDTVSDFKPELVLMDLYLGDTLGTELAQVLEQHTGYQNLPVVFLSAESATHLHFDALDKGGDNFLLKPISPANLVRAVRSRVRRARQVGTLVFSDSLTGLLNHRAIMSRMAVEVKRSQRERRELSLAVLDIDLFKPVNDTHGHAAGDRVLQAMSRMLTQRLRESDLVGRYGGEEFVVLLPNTDIDHAHDVLEEIRERFSKVRHTAPAGGHFYVTFSGGVAGRPPHGDLQSLFEAADTALYAAKASGRNRLVVEPK